MSINGEFGVNVSFQDREGSRIKVVQLSDNQRYTTGKVAIVTGTVGTATTTISSSPTSYKDATGEVVSIAYVERVAFSASGSSLVRCIGSGGESITLSKHNRVAVSEEFASDFDISVLATAGTASYTLVIYGT